MELEEQVVSLQLSQKLKELGVKQNSLIYWRDDEYPYLCLPSFGGQAHIPMEAQYSKNSKYLSAFTVAELGNMLPKSINIKTVDEDKKIFSWFRLVTGRSLIVEEQTPYEFWTVNYICDTTNELRNWLFDHFLSPPIYDKNEANARAKMLIWLIENKLVTVDK